MQHKQRTITLKKLSLLAFIAVIVGLVWLMSADIPAPQQPVEKELDAKTFLEQKQ